MVTADLDGSEVTQKLLGAAAERGITWGEGAGQGWWGPR